MSKTSRKHGSLRYSTENYILKGNNINILKGNNISIYHEEKVLSDLEILVLSQFLVLPTQWLLHTRKTFPGKNCMHPTLLIQQTLQPEGAEVSPKHGRVLWGGNRLALTPQSPLPAETGYRHSCWGGHLVTTRSHQLVKVEKFKGQQLYNLEETGNA